MYCSALEWVSYDSGLHVGRPTVFLRALLQLACLIVGLFISPLLISQLSARMVRIQMENQVQLKPIYLLHRFLLERDMNWLLTRRLQQLNWERQNVCRKLTEKDVESLAVKSTTLREEPCCAIFLQRCIRYTVSNPLMACGVRHQ